MAVIKNKIKKLPGPNTTEMEIAVARYFNPRLNLVVPNVSWGMFRHECDLLVMTKSGYLYEVEIKISLSDLIKDKSKKHGHKSDLIKKLYFAIPEKLVKNIKHIPSHAGIIVVDRGTTLLPWHASLSRAAEATTHKKISDAQKFQVARLGALRIFGLKNKIASLQRLLIMKRRFDK